MSNIRLQSISKPKSKKIRRKRATVAPYLPCTRLGSRPRPGSEGEKQKNTAQTRHSCTIFLLP